MLELLMGQQLEPARIDQAIVKLHPTAQCVNQHPQHKHHIIAKVCVLNHFSMIKLNLKHKQNNKK